MAGLIDTTEMYLRTVAELREQGIAPMRARIAERLDQTTPTVSQTVARMERDGLLTLGDERQIELSVDGEAQAMRVLRRHRLAECFLVEHLGLPLEQAHDEACRWEHVLTEDVERRMWQRLGKPTTSPYGCPLPGLDELGGDAQESFLQGVVSMAALATAEPCRARVVRMSEDAQRVTGDLAEVLQVGLRPGAEVEVLRDRGGVVASGEGGTVQLSGGLAEAIFVAEL